MNINKNPIGKFLNHFPNFQLISDGLKFDVYNMSYFPMFSILDQIMDNKLLNLYNEYDPIGEWTVINSQVLVVSSLSTYITNLIADRPDAELLRDVNH